MLLAKPGNKQYNHVKYWLGLYVKEFFPDMAVGPLTEIIAKLNLRLS